MYLQAQWAQTPTIVSPNGLQTLSNCAKLTNKIELRRPFPSRPLPACTQLEMTANNKLPEYFCLCQACSSNINQAGIHGISPDGIPYGNSPILSWPPGQKQLAPSYPHLCLALVRLSLRCLGCWWGCLATSMDLGVATSISRRPCLFQIAHFLGLTPAIQPSHLSLWAAERRAPGCHCGCANPQHSKKQQKPTFSLTKLDDAHFFGAPCSISEQRVNTSRFLQAQLPQLTAPWPPPCLCLWGDLCLAKTKRIEVEGRVGGACWVSKKPTTCSNVLKYLNCLLLFSSAGNLTHFDHLWSV